MKKVNCLLLTVVLLFFSLPNSFGQKNKSLQVPDRMQKIMPRIAIDGSEELEVDWTSVTENSSTDFQAAELHDFTKREIWLGFTSYDLMSNANAKHRIHANEDRAAAVWTFHEANVTPPTGFPNRGTGYNYVSNGELTPGLDFPSNPIEAERTGWGNIVILDSGKEVVVAHSVNHELIISTKDPGADVWLPSTVPTETLPGPGLLWPHMDASGENIHLVALSAPVANQGELYQGIDGALLYFRSQDGGVTWDKQDILLPGIDSDHFDGFQGDGYFIDVQDNYVAIANFDEAFGDIDVWFSTDNGDNWTRHKPLDFPLDNYMIDDGYTQAQIGGPDPDGPAGDGNGGIDPEASMEALLAIKLCDGTGSVAVDKNGIVHVSFGRMYAVDLDLTDEMWNIFPLTSGIGYWNSNMADNESIVIEETITAADINNNGMFDLVNDDLSAIPRFAGTSITSNPFLITTDAGHLVIAYHQVMENYIRAGVDGDPFIPNPEHYRQIFLTTSLDGINWETPYHVINEDLMVVPSLIPNTEATFPHLHTTGSSIIHLLFQWDDEPGSFVAEDAAGISSLLTSSTISYLCFNIGELFQGLSTNPESFEDLYRLTLQPNPTNSFVQIEYELPKFEQTDIQIYNLMGQIVKHYDMGLQSAGAYSTKLELNNLASGMYTVVLKNENGQVAQKLLIE